MLKTDRWRKRRPANEILSNPLAIIGKTRYPPVREVTEVVERGPAPGAVPAITGTPEVAEFDRLDELRPPFVQWFNASIKLDAKAVALRTPPTWYTVVTDLHVDFSNRTLERNLLPPTEAQFRQLLHELCCAIRTVDGEEFVANVRLREDPSSSTRLPHEERSPCEISELSELSTGPAVALDVAERERLVKEVVRLIDCREVEDDEGIFARLLGWRREDIEAAIEAALAGGP